MRALATLAPLSALCGVMTAFLFRRFAAPGTGRTVNRILAHVMELRLYFDEPSVVWKAQRDLFRENLKLLRQIAVPALVTAALLGVVIWQADAIYGRGPLPAGKAAVVTARMKSDNLVGARLEVPADVAIETPGVRIPRLREVSWRIRPQRDFHGRLSVAGDVESLDVPWPHARVLGLPWLVWFCAVSTLAALLAPRLLRWRRATMMVVVLLAASQLANAADKPPVIVISIDTLRADHLSSYGYTKIRTPNIDAFAQPGTLYEHIDSQVPLTLPSHASLMTSTYPFHSRVEENGEILPAGAVTLASILRANGYRTAAFIGSIVLGHGTGMDQGFDVYDSPFAAEGRNANPYSLRVRRDAALVLRATRQWVEKNSGQPMFVFIHLYDLHTPYTLPQAGSVTPNLNGYDAELKYVDKELGAFRQALVRDGLWDKSLVVLLSDHGESLGDHGETSHGFFIYESTMHVPLIVHWPNGKSKQTERVSQAGGLIDVAPTILDFLHIAAPPSFEGSSLLAVRKDRAVYGESVYPQEVFGWAALRSIGGWPYKYIRAPKPELYDLSKDPGESNNLLSSHLQQAHAMNDDLSALLVRYQPEQPALPTQMSAHTREVLGSLGYTAGGSQVSREQASDPKDKLSEHEAYERGLTALYSGHYQEAIATLHGVVAQDERNLPALCALGESYFRSGHSTQAVRLWQQALKQNPSYRPAAESLGDYYLEQKNLEKGCALVPSAAECKQRK